MHKIFTLFLILLYPAVYSQETRILSYNEAIGIALKESFTIRSFSENLRSMQFSYMYNKAMFKPRLDLLLFTPSWSESVSPVYQADGLPVYNSMGSIQTGGDLKFTYILPSGGNLAIHSLLYRENLSTVLASQNYLKLNTKQAYTQFGIGFEQPIFTKNALRENLKEAEYRYKISMSLFTREQMNIIYRVTEGFYGLYKATRVKEIAGEKLKNSEEAYRIAKLKAETGRIPEGDLLIAEVAMSLNKSKFSEYSWKLESEKDNFKQTIGLPIDEKIEIITDLGYDTFLIDQQKALEEGLKNRLELNESDLEIKLKQIELDRAKRENEFKGKISGYYDITGLSTVGKGSSEKLFRSSFDNLTERPPNRGITLTFSLPIYDWGRGKSREQQAKAQLNNSMLIKENETVSIVKEIRDIVRTIDEARYRLDIHKKSQEVALKSYQVSLMRFENGDITSQQLATEQERLSENQLAYLDAYITYQLAVVDLKRKTMWDFKHNRSYLEEIETNTKQ